MFTVNDSNILFMIYDYCWWGSAVWPATLIYHNNNDNNNNICIYTYIEREIDREREIEIKVADEGLRLAGQHSLVVACVLVASAGAGVSLSYHVILYYFISYHIISYDSRL